MVDVTSKDTLKGAPIDNGRSGSHATGYIRIAANVADTETVTLGADVYEFDRAADGVVAGNIAVTSHSDDTPAQATDALIAAINTRDNVVTAIDIDANTILVITKIAGTLAVAMSDTMAGGGNDVDDTATARGSHSTIAKMAHVAVTPTAEEVTEGVVRVVFDFVPANVVVAVRDTTGVVKAWDGVVTIDATNKLVAVDNTGAVDWIATDTVTLLVF